MKIPPKLKNKAPIVRYWKGFFILAQDEADFESKRRKINNGDTLGFYTIWNGLVIGPPENFIPKEREHKAEGCTCPGEYGYCPYDEEIGEERNVCQCCEACRTECMQDV